MPNFDFDPQAMRKLARRHWQVAWVDALLEDGEIEVVRHLSSNGELGKANRTFIEKLDRAGYLVAQVDPGVSCPTGVRLVLEGFDPWVGQLIGPVAAYLDLHSHDYGPMTYARAREGAFRLRALLTTESEVELAVALLPSWEPDKAPNDFLELLDVITRLLSQLPT